MVLALSVSSQRQLLVSSLRSGSKESAVWGRTSSNVTLFCAGGTIEHGTFSMSFDLTNDVLEHRLFCSQRRT